MRYKDLWFAEFERQLNEAEDRLGRPLSDKEYDHIGAKTTGDVNEQLCDAADLLRKKEKGE